MIRTLLKAAAVTFFYLLALSSLIVGLTLSSASGSSHANFAVFYVFTLLMAVAGELARRRLFAKAAFARPEPEYFVHPLIFPRATPEPDPDALVPRHFSPLDHIRDLAGPTPRRFERGIERYLTLQPPPWLAADPSDELSLNFRYQSRIRTGGPIVWGAIVQANSILFSPGPVDAPASVIYSPDPWFDAHPDDLQAIAHDLFELKGSDQADPDAATVARVLTSELTRAMRLPISNRFTAGRRVFHSSIMIPRKHLPKGYLAHSLFPVWIDPVDTGALLLVPAAFWPPTLLALWDAAPPREA